MYFRGDAFLEPYMQGLGTDFSHSSSLTTTIIKEHSADVEGSVTSSPPPVDVTDAPTNDNATLGLAADLSAQFRIIDLASSRNSLNQVRIELRFIMSLYSLSPSARPVL